MTVLCWGQELLCPVCSKAAKVWVLQQPGAGRAGLMHPVSALPLLSVHCMGTWVCTAQSSPSARAGRGRRREHRHVPGPLMGNICCCPKGAEPAGNLTNSMKFPCSKISRAFLSG